MFILLRPWSVSAGGYQYVDDHQLIIDLMREIDQSEENELFWEGRTPVRQLMYVKTTQGIRYLDPWKTWAQEHVGNGCIVFRVRPGGYWRERPSPAA